MSKNKLTVVPIKLATLPTESTIFHALHDIVAPSYIIKNAVIGLAIL